MNLGSAMANSVTLKASVKRWFFDKPGVMNRVDRGKMRVLSRFGAFVRKTAIWSIRTRKKSSQPGKPPSSHMARPATQYTTPSRTSTLPCRGQTDSTCP